MPQRTLLAGYGVGVPGVEGPGLESKSLVRHRLGGRMRMLMPLSASQSLFLGTELVSESQESHKNEDSTSLHGLVGMLREHVCVCVCVCCS